MLTICNKFGNSSRGISQCTPETTLLDGPSTSISGLVTPIACGTIGAVGVTQCGKPIDVAETTQITPTPTPTPTYSPQTTIESENLSNNLNTPINSNASTVLVVSIPNSPVNTPESIFNNTTEVENTATMPAKDKTLPAVVLTTTTAEIIDENRFAILGKDLKDDLKLNDLPLVPLENNSSGTTLSTATTPSPRNSPHKCDQNQAHKEPGTHTKHKKHHRSHNNNHQVDVNSIESITPVEKTPDFDMSWMDDLELMNINNKDTSPSKAKLRKKKSIDQLDGVPTKTHNNEIPPKEEDEKVVKCLYYTLMCCECNIS